MVHAKNYETASTFVKVIPRKLLASFFGHGVYIPYSTLILLEFPSHQIAHVGVSESITLIYLAVKLFSKYSNLCDHGTYTLPTDR